MQIDRETIMKLACEAGFKWIEFAKLVAEHEREACAKVCDDIDTEYEGEEVLATWCAAAIRARSK